MTQRLLFFVANAPYFLSHRLALAKAAKGRGFKVGLVTSRVSKQDQDILDQEGITVLPLKTFERHTCSPWQQLRTIFQIIAQYRAFSPTLVHHVGIKPVLLGTFCAKLCRIPCIINALGGLGYLFTGATPMRTALRWLAIVLFKILLRAKSTYLIVQNPDDAKVFLGCKLIAPQRLCIIKGVGVHTDHYVPCQGRESSLVTIVCVARLLWDKGIGDLMVAANLLRQQGYVFKLLVVGSQDISNPSCISTHDLETFAQQAVFVGHQKDVLPFYHKADIMVLPSYREGFPKVLLEAASCGLPIVTTHVPGCKEAVLGGKTGLLVPSKDPKALAEALALLLRDAPLRQAMGKAGRAYVMQNFSERKMTHDVLSLYDKALMGHRVS